MSPVTETTNIGWFARIKESFGAIIFGFIFFILSFILLWYNEGRAVRTAKGLKEGHVAVVTVSADTVMESNNDKIIHFSGTAVSDEILSDPLLGVQIEGLKLQRQVEVYQWREKSQTETDDKVGGSQEKVTTYTYEKVWSSSLISSSNFKEPGHDNPVAKLVDDYGSVAKMRIGAYNLSTALANKVNNFQKLSPLELNDSLLTVLKDKLKTGSNDPYSFTVNKKHSISENSIYIGEANRANPEIGDLRINYRYIPHGSYSIICNQTEGQLMPYMTSHGTSIFMLRDGLHTADSMFEAAFRQNKLKTWLLRAVGFFMMFLGINMMLRPIVVIANVLPFLGRLLGFGTGLFAGIISAVLSFITIAIAWVFYRPILGISLLVLAIGIFVFFYVRSKNKEMPQELKERYSK